MQVADEDDIPEAEGVDEIGTIVLMLGLYLIVLAFFILMNAISSFSTDKVEQIQRSVSDGFGISLDGKKSLRDNVAVAKNPVYKAISKDVKSIVDSYISVDNYRFLQTEGKMILEINISEFFKPTEVFLYPHKSHFFDSMAEVITRKRVGSDMTVEVTVQGNESDVAGTNLNALELAGRRSTLFTRALIKRDVPANKLTANATLEHESKVIMYFNVIVKD